MARQISRRFGTRGGCDVDVLRRVSLIVEPGSVCMLIGPNGAGKSTLLRILGGILPPSGGTATIAGHDVVTDPVAARAATGYLPGRTCLPPRLSCLWHVSLHASLGGMKRRESLERTGSLFSSLGIDGLRHRPTGTLSKGNRLKVALARALVHEPEVLLLDEPSAHLDHSGVSWLARTLRERSRQGAAILVVTHDSALVARAGDSLAFLSDGRLVHRESTGR